MPRPGARIKFPAQTVRFCPQNGCLDSYKAKQFT